VREADEVDWSRASTYECLEGPFSAVLGEVAQKGIAGAQRKEAQRNALLRGAAGECAIEDLVSGAVAADGDEVPVALFESLASKLNGMTGRGRSDNVNFTACVTQSSKSRAGKL